MGIVGVISGIKKIHPKDLVLINIGKFFYSYGRDAYILSYLFEYKIMKIDSENVIYIDNNLDNFPKKDIELKNRIRNTSYDLLEISYIANTTQDNIYKVKLLEQVIAKVKEKKITKTSY